MGLKLQDVQNKSKVFAEILKTYSTTLKGDKWTEADFTFEKPPDGWVTGLKPELDKPELDVEVELRPQGKHYRAWLKTKSPGGYDAKADVGELKMTYKSYLASPESVKEKRTTKPLTDHEAKTVSELWDLAWRELQTTYKDKLINDARGFFAQKLGVYDDPNTMGQYKSVKVTISEDQFSHLVNIERMLMMMRSFNLTGPQDGKKVFGIVWQGIMTRMNQNDDNAKKMASDLNNTYATDERWHYLQYVTETDQISRNMKPYVIPGEEEGTFTLQVWYK